MEHMKKCGEKRRISEIPSDIENIKYINQNRFNRFSVYKLDEAKRLQEESKSLQNESKDLIHQVRHTEKKNSVVSGFSVFLSVLFGLAQIFSSAISLSTENAQKEDWAFLCAGIVLIVGAIIFRIQYNRRDKSKEEHN